MLSPKARRTNNNRLLFDYGETLGNAIWRHKSTTAHKAARVRAELANGVNLSFIATLNHELRTPLNAILGFSEILSHAPEKKPKPDQVAEYAGYINQSADHLLSIVNGILEISKIQSGKLLLCTENTNPQEIIMACVAILSSVANDAKVYVESNMEEELPLIQVDPVKLRQIVLNILGNAIKFTPEEGAIHVQCARENDDCIRISIRDSGVGMPPDQIHIALEPFRQVETGLNRKFEGTGLGLPIAKALTEAHGGTFEIESEQNKGTEVTIILPILGIEEIAQ